MDGAVTAVFTSVGTTTGRGIIRVVVATFLRHSRAKLGMDTGRGSDRMKTTGGLLREGLNVLVHNTQLDNLRTPSTGLSLAITQIIAFLE